MATESDSTCHNDYNPTACLAGFVLRFAERGSGLYQLGQRIAREAFDAYMTAGLLADMHTAACYIRLLAYIEEAGVADIFDIAALKDKLRLQIKRGITENTGEWENGYVCKPSQFFNSIAFVTPNRKSASPKKFCWPCPTGSAFPRIRENTSMTAPDSLSGLI